MTNKSIEIQKEISEILKRNTEQETIGDGWEVDHFYQAPATFEIVNYINKLLRRYNRETESIEFEYTCPDCGLQHNNESHPPYCQDCVFRNTL